MTREAFVSNEDLFNAAAVRNARAVDDRLRESASVVKLARENITLLARYDHVSEGLKDWKTFSSTSRPWHDPKSVRPELLLTDDPPKHTGVRSVVSNALSPKALSKMAEAFRADANALVTQLKERSGTTIDAVADITQPFVYKVLPDLLGLPKEGREHMSAFGHMVWATMGPMNELFHQAMENTGPVIEWATACCNRENLDPEGLGMQMFLAADRGQVTQDEAKLLVGILLSAAADTTVMTMATAIRAFCLFPDQYKLLRSDPTLVRAAFDESLRWDSPSRMAGRITMREVEIDGVVIPEGERCGLMFAAANRDPRKWQDPDKFDIKRDHRGHVGWGYGVHSCVGRVLALLEADALLGAVIGHIERFEAAGEPEPWMTTIGHGPAKLPVRFTASSH
jgi:4-methoxybenzoate monooxygenase (O-demethylating)